MQLKRQRKIKIVTEALAVACPASRDDAMLQFYNALREKLLLPMFCILSSYAICYGVVFQIVISSEGALYVILPYDYPAATF